MKTGEPLSCNKYMYNTYYMCIYIYTYVNYTYILCQSGVVPIAIKKVPANMHSLRIGYCTSKLGIVDTEKYQELWFSLSQTCSLTPQTTPKMVSPPP